MSSILVVEDENMLREIIVDYLENENYKAIEAEDGEKAVELFENNQVDLVILDINLPKLNGWSVCRKIREKSNLPIIILTARADEDDSILGYELGADDYLIKPYNPRILMAKVKRFIEKQLNNKDDILLEASGITVNIESRNVLVDNEIINLTYTEFEILAYLMANKNIVITREQLISRLWGYDFFGDEKTINSHIRNLRAKLGKRGVAIVTVIRLGYKFEDRTL